MAIKDSIFQPEEIGERTYKIIEESANDPQSGLSIGIPDVDRIMRPMRRGEFIGVLGYTSNYKTGFMNYVARYNAKRINMIKSDKIVLSFLWEQSIEEQGLVDIMHSTARDGARINIQQILDGRLNTDDLKRLHAASLERGALPWWLIGHSATQRKRQRMSMTDVAEATYHVMEVLEIKPALIVIDYLQRIKREPAGTMREAFMDIVDRIKDMALYAECPTIVASQAKRDVRHRKWALPRQDDAQETSNFEQTSDKLFALWYCKQTKPDGEELNIEGTSMGKRYGTLTVDDHLVILGLIKQKFGIAPISFALDVKPETNEIYAKTTLSDVQQQ